MYELSGVVVHQGTANVGHYITFARPRDESRETWFRFDDERVDVVRFEDVLAESIGGCVSHQKDSSANHCVSSTAYILMYELKNNY